MMCKPVPQMSHVWQSSKCLHEWLANTLQNDQQNFLVTCANTCLGTVMPQSPSFHSSSGTCVFAFFSWHPKIIIMVVSFWGVLHICLFSNATAMMVHYARRPRKKARMWLKKLWLVYGWQNLWCTSALTSILFDIGSSSRRLLIVTWQ